MEVGDIVKGKPDAPHAVTNESMTRGVVTSVDGDRIRVRIQKHAKGESGSYLVSAAHFEVIGHAKPFDRTELLELLAKGCKKAILDYDLRGADLCGADLCGADLRGADLRGADLRGADLCGADLCDADLCDADLCDANLRGANLDFSCWPIWCGSLRVKVDTRLACQLAYHLCSMQCDDEEYRKMRNSIIGFANKFHRVGECGVLTEEDSK